MTRSFGRIYVQDGGLKFGPGGITCQCCTPWHCHPRTFKPLMHRLERRKAKLTTKSAVQEWELELVADAVELSDPTSHVPYY